MKTLARSARSILAVLVLVGSGVSAQPAEDVDGATRVDTSRAIHFPGPDGSDVLLPEGSYSVAWGEDMLRLTGKDETVYKIAGEEDGLPEVITTQAALAVDPEDEDRVFLVLVNEDGQALVATGSFSGTVERGYFDAKHREERRKKRKAAVRKVVKKVGEVVEDKATDVCVAGLTAALKNAGAHARKKSDRKALPSGIGAFAKQKVRELAKDRDLLDAMLDVSQVLNTPSGRSALQRVLSPEAICRDRNAERIVNGIVSIVGQERWKRLTDAAKKTRIFDGGPVRTRGTDAPVTLTIGYAWDIEALLGVGSGAGVGIPLGGSNWADNLRIYCYWLAGAMIDAGANVGVSVGLYEGAPKDQSGIFNDWSLGGSAELAAIPASAAVDVYFDPTTPIYGVKDIPSLFSGVSVSGGLGATVLPIDGASNVGISFFPFNPNPL